MAAVDTPTFWQELYEHGGDGWELGGPHPSLELLIGALPPPPGRVAVPGCGRGHDARLLARKGYQVVGLDFAPAAVAEARRLAAADGLDLAVEQRDIFTLGRDRAGAFDGVWEYTCFCAIDPGRRPEYVRVLADVLVPGGWLLGCFYPVRPGAGGPPFPVELAEVRALLAPWFRIERDGPPPRPVPQRAGQEWIIQAVRLAA